MLLFFCFHWLHRCLSLLSSCRTVPLWSVLRPSSSWGLLQITISGHYPLLSSVLFLTPTVSLLLCEYLSQRAVCLLLKNNHYVNSFCSTYSHGLWIEFAPQRWRWGCVLFLPCLGTNRIICDECLQALTSLWETFYTFFHGHFKNVWLKSNLRMQLLSADRSPSLTDTACGLTLAVVNTWLFTALLFSRFLSEVKQTFKSSAETFFESVCHWVWINNTQFAKSTMCLNKIIYVYVHTMIYK